MASPAAGNVEAPSDSIIPSGIRLLTSIPDLLMFPELVFGGLVWILVASIKVYDPDTLGWVIFVSLLLFALTLLLLFCYLFGLPRNSSAWCFLDAFYHGIGSVFYFSGAVLVANATVRRDNLPGKIYDTLIAASVFAYVATVLYVIHAIFSFKRWKTV
ncbi:myelin and lymphocyte protein-like [Narcine bancroftii]|uniref:myelin and lymphocyte protein-like n=1 Tax=Narcine bancroftii TaxID=1343680 RepID=UPI0038318A8A